MVTALFYNSLDGVPIGKLDLGAGRKHQQLRHKVAGHLVELPREQNCLYSPIPAKAYPSGVIPLGSTGSPSS